ncbi:hypothetical protein SLE2022_238610 [Rubroshorea leprosula]
MMRRSLTSRSSSSSFNTGFSYSTIAVDPTAGGRGDSPDFYSANANCMDLGLENKCYRGERLLLWICLKPISPFFYHYFHLSSLDFIVSSGFRASSGEASWLLSGF